MNSTQVIQPTQLLIFGAGGHGRVVADAASCGGSWNIIQASDRDPSRCRGELLEGIAIVRMDNIPMDGVLIHVAIGNNLFREREAGSWGHPKLASVVHPAAAISRFCRVGAGCFVAAGAVLAPGAVLGAGVIVNHGAVVDHDVQVGDFTHIAPHATLGGGVEIGGRVLVGACAAVLPGIRIGDDVTVGAGAVVHTDLMEPGIYAGVPARRIR